MAMTEADNKSKDVSSHDGDGFGWTCGCGCLVMIAFTVLYIYGGIKIWTDWLIPYFAEVIQDTKESVQGATESLIRIFDLQCADWLVATLVWILLIVLIGNRIWATVQPKLVCRVVRPMVFRPMASWGTLLVPECAFILACLIQPCLECLNNWVNAGDVVSWRRTAWNLLMGDFCLKHGIVAAYFLFCPVLLRWYFAFALPGGESMVFGLNLGETLPESFKCELRFRMMREAERTLFHDLRLGNECKEILLKNVDCSEKCLWTGYTLYYCIVPNTRQIYMLVLSGKGKRQWRRTRESVKSIFKHYKFMWTFREQELLVGEKEFVVEHQSMGTSMKFKCDSTYQFELRLTHRELFQQAIDAARRIAGSPCGGFTDEKNGEIGELKVQGEQIQKSV